MPTEYYDRGMPETRLLPASRRLQDEYWLLRSALCGAVAANWVEIRKACPEVAEAAEALETFLAAHPTRTFDVFRPEDAGVRQEDGSSTVFFR